MKKYTIKSLDFRGHVRTEYSTDTETEAAAKAVELSILSPDLFVVFVGETRLAAYADGKLDFSFQGDRRET